MVLKEARGAVAIPRNGVRTGEGDQRYVLIVEGGKIARRDVIVGLTDEVRALTEIRNGLNAGETAVVGPAEGLKVGEPVQVVGREG